MKHSVDPNAELVVIPTRLFGPKGKTLARMALDTGATMSLLSHDLLTAIGYKPAREKERISITTGSGTASVPVVSVNRMKAWGKTHRGFRFLCHNLPPGATVDGLLGPDFLRGRRLVLDFRKGQASLD